VANVRAAHSQASYDVRLEWGPTGGAAITADADIAVVVDVLSFTTTLSIAVAGGTRVYPFRWKDERARAHAVERDAVLAVGRLEARDLRDAPPSLSPAQLLTADPVARLVLPSPNGSTICTALERPRLTVVGASLRNRTAVAQWLLPRIRDGATLAVVPAGERWPDGSLRPAVEDLWGTGAVLAALGPVERELSPEAEHSRASYEQIAGEIGTALAETASGRELASIGFARDVGAAADLDADDVVPVLGPDGFAAAELR
jgi:2-phosphosulfolactate phosphatase